MRRLSLAARPSNRAERSRYEAASPASSPCLRATPFCAGPRYSPQRRVSRAFIRRAAALLCGAGGGSDQLFPQIAGRAVGDDRGLQSPAASLTLSPPGARLLRTHGSLLL